MSAPVTVCCSLLKLLGHDVFAVDLFDHAEDAVYKMHGIPFAICNVEADPLPFESESFDAVSCCQALEHFTHSRRGLVVTSFLAFAAMPMSALAVGWVNKTTIARVTVHDWVDAVFLYTATSASTEGCSGGGSPLILLRSNPQFKEIYAAAMAAALTKTVVGGYTYGCDPAHYNLPILQRIDVMEGPSAPYP